MAYPTFHLGTVGSKRRKRDLESPRVVDAELAGSLVRYVHMVDGGMELACGTQRNVGMIA